MKHKMLLEEASPIISRLIGALLPHCIKLAVAGSARRKRPEIGDIELVVIPAPALDMFGLENGNQLEYLDWSTFGGVIKSGPKYKQIALPEGLNLDLFIVTPPAQWGVIFLIRTGPAEFSRKLVTHKAVGGLLPDYLRVKDGAIWSSNHIIETPEERDVFDLLGIPYIEAEARQ